MIKYCVYWLTQRAGLNSKVFNSLREVNEHCKHFNVIHIETVVE